MDDAPLSSPLHLDELATFKETVLAKDGVGCDSIATAFFNVSMDLYENSRLGDSLIEYLESQGSEEFMVRIPCRQMKSLKAIISFIVERFIETYDLTIDFPIDYHSFDVILKIWNDSMPGLILVLDSFESMKKDVLNDFLQYLRAYSLEEKCINVKLVLMTPVPLWNMSDVLSVDNLCALSILEFCMAPFHHVVDTVILNVRYIPFLGCHFKFLI